MKRTIPLLITFFAGTILIFSSFIPFSESWGEEVAVWFDVLGAIAFVLGGGNLIKVHLKKISDRAMGWGYSAVTILAFLVTLWIGLAKVGVPPAANQQHYGEVFAHLPLDEFLAGAAEQETTTLISAVEGTLPRRGDEELLPLSVRRQVREIAIDDKPHVQFIGWMQGGQKSDLLSYEDTLEWKCLVEKLAEAARPPEELRGKITYYGDHSSLSFSGYMEEETEEALLELSETDRWKTAIAELASKSRLENSTTISLNDVNISIPEKLQESATYDDKKLSFKGPMSISNRDELGNLATAFPLVTPMSTTNRARVIAELEQRGKELTEPQQEALNKAFDATWNPTVLINTLNAAGVATAGTKNFCTMLSEKESEGAVATGKKEITDEDVRLNDEQKEIIRNLAAGGPFRVSDLNDALKATGDFTGGQEGALAKFYQQVHTWAEFQKRLGLVLIKTGPLNNDQKNFLFDDHRKHFAWKQAVSELFQISNAPKYAWSGDYRSTGGPFWWIYEYIFKPLTATMFSMLAFYVASAAFRAFRAKNLEAMLLLGTAFIILLGRTFAGVLLTSWIPDSLSAFRIEEMTVYIMQLFNTAGNRAIMIGIALGIASTSLKVLLGIDRSYLGSSDD